MYSTLLTDLIRYTPRGIELGGPADFGYKDMKPVSVADKWHDPERITTKYRLSS